MDKFFKRSFKDIRVMRELLQAHFSQDILKNMDLSTLKIEKNTFVSKGYQNSETDLLYSVRYKDATAFVYILCEMQGTIDEDMLLRLMGYLHSFYDLYRKQHPKEPLPVVYPIILYAGEKIWNAPLNFFDLFGKNKHLVKSIFTKDVSFIDIHRLPDNGIEQYRWVGLFELVLKYRHVRDLTQFLKKTLPWLNELEFCGGSDYAQTVINYIINELEAEDKTLFIEAANQYLSETLRGEVMTLAQQFVLEGEQRGIQIGEQRGIQIGEQRGIHIGEQRGEQRGIQIGEQRAIREMVLNMLDAGIKKENVATIIKININQLEDLLQDS